MCQIKNKIRSDVKKLNYNPETQESVMMSESIAI